MKKLRLVRTVALIALVAQLFTIPVFAAEIQEDTLPAGTVQASSGTFGTVATQSGCRTIDAQIPLGGNERILETAQSAFIYELNTSTVLYSYYPDTAVSPGGLAKMLNAIVALENTQLSDKVVISTANHKTLPVGARNSKLKQDEELTMEDLLNLMLLDVSNDAALAIAEHISGSEAEYVKLMSQKAQEIGMTDSVFLNCHGLEKTGQYTTARDLVLLVQYAIKNPKFEKIFNSKSYTVPETNKSQKRAIKSLNYLIEETIVPKYNKDEVVGGMASYASNTGASIAFTAEDKGMFYIMIITGSERRFRQSGTVDYYGNFEEAWDLVAFAFDNYRICRLLHDGQSVTQFPVANGENEVVAQSHTDMDVILPKDARLKNLILKYSVVGGGLRAPISNDQKIATLEMWYRNSCVAETELYAMSQVREAGHDQLQIQGAGRDDSNWAGFLKFLGIAALVVVVPFGIYLIINNVRRSIAMNRRRRRRRSRRRSR